MKKSLALGLLASFFFAFTFILNKQMSLMGGSWLYSASLRYIFTLPILAFIMIINKQSKPVFLAIKEQPIKWFLWSFVGFGFFYAPLSFASSYGPSWLVAGTWQVTIVAGALMSPLFYTKVIEDGGERFVRNKIPVKSLLMSLFILVGVGLMQIEQSTRLSPVEMMLGTLPVIIAAFAYPLGNRKMIEVVNGQLTTLQRIFGMTLCSMPFWILLFIIGFVKTGMPAQQQIFQSLIVAVFTGIIATSLFFKAMDLVSGDMRRMAIIESTQSGAVLWTILGGILVFGNTIPANLSIVGLCFIVIGMIANRLAIRR